MSDRPRRQRKQLRAGDGTHQQAVTLVVHDVDTIAEGVGYSEVGGIVGLQASEGGGPFKGVEA